MPFSNTSHKLPSQICWCNFAMEKKNPGFPTTAAGSRSGFDPSAEERPVWCCLSAPGFLPNALRWITGLLGAHATHASWTCCRHLLASGRVRWVLKVASCMVAGWGFKGGRLLWHCKQSCCLHKAPFIFFWDTQRVLTCSFFVGCCGRTTNARPRLQAAGAQSQDCGGTFWGWRCSAWCHLFI